MQVADGGTEIMVIAAAGDILIAAAAISSCHCGGIGPDPWENRTYSARSYPIWSKSGGGGDG
jgi:hypothetical protein